MELEARVRAHVASGLYGSASEVIREALRLFEAYQSVQQSNLAALKADIDQGMADLDAGRVSKMDMAAIKAQGAQTDLLEAWSFIAEESFEAADHVLEVIEKEALTLALQPLMGRARPELNKEVRCWPTSAAYNLYYVASDSGITVI
eukprot:gene22379-28501_t